MRIKDCPECLEYLYGHPHLIEACASVGISRGRSTSDMLVAHISGYHRRGHRELDHEVAGQILSADRGPDDSSDLA